MRIASERYVEVASGGLAGWRAGGRAGEAFLPARVFCNLVTNERGFERDAASSKAAPRHVVCLAERWPRTQGPTARGSWMGAARPCRFSYLGSHLATFPSLALLGL